MSKEMFSISRLLNEYEVFIPEIQRDYAQGRDNAKDIRDHLLEDIFSVLRVGSDKDQCVLNYIYGVPSEGKLVLIDGQQRITTLFLCKCYLAFKCDGDKGFLSRLQYATRDTSREFCDFLAKHGECLKNNDKPSVSIKNHIDFSKRWLNDPTVFSMINMLDSIDEEYKKGHVDADRLDRINFSFISLDGFKRKNELYAAMNSRGKELTPFELIKGELLNQDASLSKVINGEWLPLFWNYAKTISPQDRDPEEYAAETHDRFLYNYFLFLSRLIWWWKSNASSNVKKGDSIPDIMAVTKEIYQESSNREFLLFAMRLVETDLSTHSFAELTRDVNRHKDDSIIVLFDGKEAHGTEFFKMCCLGEDFTQADRCYLWAYVKYMWDNQKQKQAEEKKNIVEYYLLMRSLFMLKASNVTPTSVGKLSLNEEELGSVVIPFNSITNNETKYSSISQYKAFESVDTRKYAVLNNPLVRGCTDNIWEYLSDNLKNNLKWLYETSDEKMFVRMVTCGFDNLKCEFGGYYDRVFLPVQKQMIKSVFSQRGWENSQDYRKLMEYLRDNSLEGQNDPTLAPSQWEYYVNKYESFRDSIYGQYRVESSSHHMTFNAEFIYNERATKNMVRNPFIYELYERKGQSKGSYSDFVTANNVIFEYSFGKFTLSFDGKDYECGDDVDVIEYFESKLP